MIDKGAEFDRQFTKISWLIVMKQITYTIGNELIKYLEPNSESVSKVGSLQTEHSSQR